MVNWDRSVRAAIVLATLALAHAAPADAHDDPSHEEEGPNTGRISLLVQNDLSNAYIFRGIMQERDGWIWQPWGELYINLFESDEGLIRSLTIGGGVWNSVHSEHTLAASSPRALYETDWYPLISVGLPAGLSLTGIYYFYTSPNDAFDTVEAANFKLAWDDSEYLGRWSLKPWVNLEWETERTSFGDEEGQGVQMGIAPTLFQAESPKLAIGVTLPVEVGLAIDDYYEEADGDEDTFGYASAGLVASFGLSFIPADYGAWTLSVGGKYFYLSNTLADVNEGDKWFPQAIGSLSLSY